MIADAGLHDCKSLSEGKRAGDDNNEFITGRRMAGWKDVWQSCPSLL